MNTASDPFAIPEISNVRRGPLFIFTKIGIIGILFVPYSLAATEADPLSAPDMSVTYGFDDHLISDGRPADYLTEVVGLPQISSQVVSERCMLFAQVRIPRLPSRGRQPRKRSLSVERLESRRVLNGTTISIDQAWIDSQPPGEIVLTEASATYILNTDIVAEGTAIVVGNEDITLDLNGHTVTYGDASPTLVSNAGFEQGTGTNVIGWDVSGASSAQLASNDHFLFGDQVLRLEDFSTTQTIVSSTIDIAEAGHTYSAHITPGARADSQTELTLSIIDVDTGEVLASGNTGNVALGIFDPVTFFADTTHSVQLKIEVTPGDGVTTTVDLDYATITRSFDYGILASRLWSGSLAGYENLTDAAKAVYRSANNFTLLNGHVMQGQAKGLAANPLMFDSINGLTVANIETFSHGIDTEAIHAHNIGANAYEQSLGIQSRSVIIQDSVFRHNVDNMTNRYQQKMAIGVDGRGNILIERNVVDSAPHIGIKASNSSQFDLIIRDNVIHQRSIVTNGYGIVIATAHNFELSNNTITADSGRGILIDGYSSIGVSDGNIFGNYVDVQEAPNREFYDELTATALRLRNATDQQGAHHDINVHDNVFIAATGVGLVRRATAGKLTYVNNNGEMDDAGILLEANVFRAVTYDKDYDAKAFALVGADAGINILVTGNDFQSNNISLQLGDGDGGNSFDTTFISNTISRLDDGPPDVSYSGIVSGYWIRELENIRLVDMRFTNGATDSILWQGSGQKQLFIEELLTLRVEDDNGTAISAASVTVNQDAIGRSTTMTADAAGDVDPVAVVREILTYDTTVTTQVIDVADVATTAEGYEDDARTVSIVDELPMEIVTLQSDGSEVNAPPTVSLINMIGELAEDLDLSSGLRVADIVVSDDQLGTNTLSLAADDANLFEIVSNQLRLKAGVSLDNASNPSLDVTVQVDDATVGATPDDTTALAITVLAVNDPPTVSLINTISELTEDLDLSSGLRVADIVVSDDQLGTNTLSLAGDDANLFEIVGNQLRLKAGVSLDNASNSSLDVTVQVDDATVGATPDDTTALAITVLPINAPPTFQLTNVITSISANVDTSVRIKIADLVISDDDQGSNTVSFAGPDKDMFEFDSGVIYLNAGSFLDATSNPLLKLKVTVNDTSVGMSPDDLVKLQVGVIEVGSNADNVEFIRSLYVDVMEREGDDANVTVWADAMENGTSRRAVAKTFLNSAERLSSIITDIYDQFLHRDADTAGLAYWVSYVQNGASVALVEQHFVASSEYSHSYEDDASFVTALYRDINDRDPDQSGLNYWLGTLNNHLTRTEVGRLFLYSDERVGAAAGDTYVNYFDETIDHLALAIHIEDIQDGDETAETIAVDWLASDLYYAKLAS